MSQNEIELELPAFCLIPYAVQADENLPESAKIYFGQLSGLAKKWGYCYATDDQLAKMKNTSIVNIKRWNTLLEKAGFIERKTVSKNIKKNPHDSNIQNWKKERKIYVTDGFSKKPKEYFEEENEEKEDSNNNYGSINDDMSSLLEGIKKDMTPLLEGIKNEPYNNKLINMELSKQQPKVVVFSSIDKLDIPIPLKEKILKKYTHEEIELAVKRTLAWEHRKSDVIGIQTTLNKADTWCDNPTGEDIERINNDFLMSLSHLDNAKVGPIQIIIGNGYIEFNSNMKCDVFKINDTYFKTSVTEFLKKLKIPVDINAEMPQLV